MFDVMKADGRKEFPHPFNTCLHGSAEMNAWLRSYATPLSFTTFIAVGLTGILMLFGVRGGLIGEIHEWLGVVFVVALVLHLARNWRGVLAMLHTTSGKLIAGGLGLATVALILFALPTGGDGGHGGGHGPWRVVNVVANAPIEKMAPAMGLTADEVIAKLKAGGVPADSTKESLGTISRDHGVPVPRMLNLMLSPGGGDADED
jgi:hypothetical protein